MQQDRPGLRRVLERLLHTRKHRLLLLRQLQRLRGQKFLILKGVALHPQLTPRDPAMLHQWLDDRRCPGHFTAKLTQSHLTTGRLEQVEDPGLHRRPALHFLKRLRIRRLRQFQVAVHDERLRLRPHRLWQHRPQHSLHRHHVVARDPMRQFQQARREHRPGPHHRQDLLEPALELRVHHIRDHHCRHLLPLKWHQDPRPHRHPRRQLLGNHIVQFQLGGVLQLHPHHPLGRIRAPDRVDRFPPRTRLHPKQIPPLTLSGDRFGGFRVGRHLASPKRGPIPE